MSKKKFPPEGLSEQERDEWIIKNILRPLYAEAEQDSAATKQAETGTPQIIMEEGQLTPVIVGYEQYVNFLRSNHPDDYRGICGRVDSKEITWSEVHGEIAKGYRAYVQGTREAALAGLSDPQQRSHVERQIGKQIANLGLDAAMTEEQAVQAGMQIGAAMDEAGYREDPNAFSPQPDTPAGESEIGDVAPQEG